MANEAADLTMQKIVALAQSKGDGQFQVKIAAKRPGSMVPTNIATFAECTLAHIAAIDGWLPRLVGGGGEYSIVVSHASDMGTRHVFSVSLLGAAYEVINANAINSPDWLGPTNLLNAPVLQQQVAAPPAYAPPQFQHGAQMQGYQRSPFGNGIPPTPAGAQAVAAMSQSAAESLLTVQREEARANGSLAAREAALAAKETEARIRAEASEREAAIRRETDRKMDELKAAIVANKPAPVEKGTSLAETIAAIAAAFAPIAAAVINSQAETRKLTMELNFKQAEAAAANARAIAELQQKTAESNQAMMFKMMERPAQSPEMAAMLDMNRAHAETQGSMMNQMVNAMGTVSKISISMIETIADLNAPPEGSPVLDAVKEGVKGLTALMHGVDKGARGNAAGVGISKQPVQRPQQQVPAQNQPSPAQLAAAQERAKQVAAVAEAQQRATQVPQPVNVVPFPPPTIVPSPHVPPPAPLAALVPAAQQVVDVEPTEQPGAFDGIETKSSVDELEDLIRAHHQPPEAVATFFLDALKTPELQGALKHPDVQGDPNRLIAKHLGLVWLSDAANQQYIELVGESLEKQGIERGLIKPDDDDDAADALDAAEADPVPETPAQPS